MANKGLKRLAFFVVFLIPVGWYFFLQLFGSNKFALTSVEPISEECGNISTISVLYTGDSTSVGQTNYLDRVVYQTITKDVPFLYGQSLFFDCLQIENELILANKDGIWGVYKLDRGGVDQLLTELDILIIQTSYGEGTSR